jgi:hypothetical protein
MKITELLNESTPRTLYHGTLMKFVPTIMKFGILPSVGEFTKMAYKEYEEAGISLPTLVFAADRKSLEKCISSIRWYMTTHKIPLTVENFYKQAAIVIIKRGETNMQHRPNSSDWKDLSHPDTVEPGDYYSEDTVCPYGYLSGNKLRNFLRRNSIFIGSLGFERDLDIENAEIKRVFS